MPPVDPEQECAAGSLEAVATFTNKHAISPKEFEAAIETKLAAIATNLSGTITLLPNHDPTGVILGNG